MVPHFLCYLPPSVEFLGTTTPQVFKPGPTTPQFSNQIDAHSSAARCIWFWCLGIFIVMVYFAFNVQTSTYEQYSDNYKPTTTRLGF